MQLLLKLPLLLLWMALASSRLVSCLYSEPLSLIINTNPQMKVLIQQAVLAYAVDHPTINITVNTVSDAQSQSDIQQNKVDIGFNVGFPKDADLILTPDLITWPVAAIATVPIYNLPNMPAGWVLTLSVPVLQDIWLGNIYMWDHPNITVLNPTVTMPHKTIVVTIRSTSSAASQTWQRTLSTDSNAFFHAFVNTTGKPVYGNSVNWSAVTYNRSIPACPAYQTVCHDANTPGQVVLDTPYSIGYFTYANAYSLNVPMANMVNTFGAVISPTADSVAFASIEKGLNTSLTTWSSCSLGYGRFVWPICTYAMMQLRGETTRTTCAAKQAGKDFIDWFTTSSTVAALANSDAISTSILPALAVANLQPYQIVCSGEQIGAAVKDKGIISGATAPLQTLLTLFTSYYADLESSYTFSVAVQDQRQSINQVLNGEVDIALVDSDLLRASQPSAMKAFLQSGDLVILPAYLMNTAIVYNPPVDIMSLTPNVTYNKGKWKLPLYGGSSADRTNGLLLDTATLYLIFNGSINQWNDARILQYNPWLSERYSYAAQNALRMMTNITLVLCCSDSSDHRTAGHMLARGFASDPNSLTVGTAFSAVPFEWSTINASLTHPAVTVATEQMTYEKIVNTDGAIGYTLGSEATPNYAEVVAIVTPNGNNTITAEDVARASLNGMRNCTQVPQDISDINAFSLELDDPRQLDYCYPFSQLLSFVVLSHYKESHKQDVALANVTLNFVQWLMTTSSLSPAANFAGVARMQEVNDTTHYASIKALQSIQCNGKNCLITLPEIWTVSSGIQSFGYAMGVIGIVLCTAMLFMVIQFRNRTVIKSASTVFQCIILFGLLLLFIATMVIVQPPTLATCGSFAWLVDLGLTIALGPLFLKMYRIYKIFNRKQLKVVKISNSRLLGYLGLLVLFDLVLLSAFQGTAPLQPITTHIYEGVLDKRYTQCNATPGSDVFLVLLGVEKALLLLFGCFMSFGTRKVSSTFNESSSVGWSIYNTIFAAIVVIAIITFVGAVGDTLVLMELLLLLWIAAATLGFLFFPKVYTILQGEQAEQFSALESQRTFTGGFSFVSVDALTKATIAPYIAALHAHLQSVKRREAILEGRHVGTEASALRPEISAVRREASTVNEKSMQRASYESRNTANTTAAQQAAHRRSLGGSYSIVSPRLLPTPQQARAALTAQHRRMPSGSTLETSSRETTPPRVGEDSLPHTTSVVG